MTTDSFTSDGRVIATDWTTVSSISGITFTSGNKYNICVTGECKFKVANYVQEVRNPVTNTVTFDYTATDDDLYIKTDAQGIILSILDCGAAS